MSKGQSDADKLKEKYLRTEDSEDESGEIEHEVDEEARLHAPEVNYMGPKFGPFKCGHCFFFDAKESRCEHPDIEARVDSAGCCNQYRSVDEELHS